jgi:AcrR family transcriptional regulator
MGHRELLLDAARRCLETKGYAHTTARDLVAESGTNLASIGYHFGSKDALLQLALEQAQADYTSKILEASSRPDKLTLSTVRDTWTAVADGFGEHRPLNVSFLEALVQAERSPDLLESLAQTYRDLRRAVAESIRNSDLDLGDTPVDVLASFMIAVCDGLLIQWLLDPTEAAPGDAVFDAALRLFANARPSS